MKLAAFFNFLQGLLVLFLCPPSFEAALPCVLPTSTEHKNYMSAVLECRHHYYLLYADSIEWKELVLREGRDETPLPRFLDNVFQSVREVFIPWFLATVNVSVQWQILLNHTSIC